MKPLHQRPAMFQSWGSLAFALLLVVLVLLAVLC